jgi:hypothetical protein
VEFVRHLTEPQTKSLASLAEHYQQRFREAVLVLQTGATEPKTRSLIAQFEQLLVSNRAMWTDSDKTDSAVPLIAEYRDLRLKRLEKAPTKSQLAMAMWDGTGIDEHLLIRGNSSLKTTGPTVPRRLLEAIEADLASTQVAATTIDPLTFAAVPVTGSGRLQLAGKLTNPRNPFPSRVMVNRIWHHLFGRGIVPSVDNFGVLGQAPTHPELLDQLALEFIADGWSVKRAIRRMVLSSTYQMASSGVMNRRDPLNELYHQAPLRRLEGEVIRDSIIALSGRLNPKQFGPSIAVHLTPFMQGRGRPGSGPLDGDGRRSIYLGIRRNFLSPMMLAFDSPIPFSTVGRRNVSNVPAQALILMNDPFVLDQAKLWAKKVLVGKTSTTEEKINTLYEQAFSRPATKDEIAAAIEFLQLQGKEYGLEDDRIEGDERVWSDLCHVLMNSKEFVFLR